jgi:DNA-damage-inducible protein J
MDCALTVHHLLPPLTDPAVHPIALDHPSIYLDNPASLSCIVAHQEGYAMTGNCVVRARIDQATKSEAAAVLAAMGLSLSDAFRLLLKRVAAEKALPFEPLVPNAATIAAMKAARRGDVVTAGKPGSLLASLNADC